jgi:hypothetical protein
MDSLLNSGAFGGNQLQEGTNVNDEDEDIGTSLKWASCQGPSDVVLATAMGHSNMICFNAFDPKLRGALNDEGFCFPKNQGDREIVIKPFKTDTLPERRLVKCLEEHAQKKQRFCADQTRDITGMELLQTQVKQARDLLCSVMESPASNPVELYTEYIEHYTTDTVLACSAFGMAYLAEDSRLPMTFVVKTIQLTKSDQATIDELRTSLQQEISVRNLLFPFIVAVALIDLLIVINCILTKTDSRRSHDLTIPTFLPYMATR